MINKLKKIDYRHYICIGISLLIIIFVLFHFKYIFPRIFETLIDLITSFVFYFCELFDIDFPWKITINELSKLPFKMPFNLPNTFEEFKLLWHNYWKIYWSWNNLTLYLVHLGNILYYISKIILVIMPLFIIIGAFMGMKSDQLNNDYNKDSKKLIWWKTKFEKKFYLPVKKWILDFIKFNKEHSYYLKLCLFMFALGFNLVSVMIECLAYYLFFVSSFKMNTMYLQVIKLFMDLSIMIDFIPGVVWFLIFLFIVDFIRKKIALDNLNHYELKNRGFINDRAIVLMLCGTMGKKKTTIITDMAISQEIMLRDKAFEKILEADLKFPFFPWINLENSIKQAFENHTVYNLASCQRFVDSKHKKFLKNPHIKNIFMYNYKRYGYEYDSKIGVVNIWKVIEDYTKLYFIYIIQSSLIISNYSIRVDNVLMDEGNFPLWDTDLFRNDSRMMEAYSRHSHILDFDSLRLGKKIIENNPFEDSFEFGVVNLTEIGKERKNALELQGIKKMEETTNQKNDKFNEWLKMCRHSATVDNYPFIKVITDEQRPESWGADARDLLEVVHINDCSEKKLSMPLFDLEELVITTILSKFKRRYYNYRYLHGDNTLPMYLYHGLIGKLSRFYQGIYNTYGYYKMKLSVEDGTQVGKDGPNKDAKYYLMFKKIYSRRFSTDCYSDYFLEKSIRSQYGIDDLPEFENEKASYNELQQENSYFINEITETMKVHKKK